MNGQLVLSNVSEDDKYMSNCTAASNTIDKSNIIVSRLSGAYWIRMEYIQTPHASVIIQCLTYIIIQFAKHRNERIARMILPTKVEADFLILAEQGLGQLAKTLQILRHLTLVKLLL